MEKGIGTQLGIINQHVDSLQNEVKTVKAWLAEHSVVKRDDAEPILTDLDPDKTPDTRLKDRKIEAIKVALNWLDDINEKLDGAQTGLAALRKTLVDYDVQVVDQADLQRLIPEKSPSGGAPRQKLTTRDVTPAEGRRRLPLKPEGQFVVGPRRSVPSPSSSTLVSASKSDATRRQENPDLRVSAEKDKSAKLSTTTGAVTHTKPIASGAAGRQDSSGVWGAESKVVPDSTQRRPDILKSDSVSQASQQMPEQHTTTQAGSDREQDVTPKSDVVTEAQSRSADDSQPLEASAHSSFSTSNTALEADDGTKDGLLLLGNEVPQFKHARSRFAKMLEATKRKEGDSRIRHKEHHVKLLMRSMSDTFVQRNKCLDDLDDLATSAQEAEAFAQNADNRPFLHFTYNPRQYYRKSANKTVKVPQGEGKYKEERLPVLIRNKVDQIKEQEGLTIDDGTALNMVAEDLAKSSVPYKTYLENKKKWDHREFMINDLVSRKGEFKRDIEEARDVKYRKELEKSHLLEDLVQKYPNLHLSSGEKDKKALNAVYNILKLEQKRLKQQKGELLFRLTGLKMASLNKFVSIRKSARRKAAEEVRLLEKQRFNIKQDIAKIEESIDEVQELRSTLKKYNWAADSLIQDLKYSAIRRDEPNNEF